MNSIVLLTIIFFSCICASYGATITAELSFTCRQKIPANEISPIESLYWKYSYEADVTCATYTSLPARREYDITFTNGTVGHTARVDQARSITTTDDRYYITTLSNFNGTCDGAFFGEIRVVPRKDINRCVAGECILTEVVSDATISVLGGGCGVNLCKGFQKQTFNNGSGIE